MLKYLVMGTNLSEILPSDCHLLADNFVDGILVFDGEKKLILINKSARSFLNIKLDQFPQTEQLAPIFEKNFDFHRRLDECLKFDRSLDIENFSFDNKVYSLSIAPFKLEDRNVARGVLLQMTDITESRKLEKLKRDFTAMMVHELRAPLSTMYGSADNLLTDHEKMTKEQLLTSFKLIKESSNWLLNIVNDLLDVSKLESGKFEIIKEWGDLLKLLENRVGFFKVSAEEKGLSLELKKVGHLPSISFDLVRMESVLNNLISNAIKFSASGKVTVSAKLGEGEVVVSVSDSGPGIPPEELPNLFLKYRQLNKMVRGAGEKMGTGLGLFIAKGIVEAHGGRIWVKSKVGEGSTFSFSIPVDTGKVL